MKKYLRNIIIALGFIFILPSPSFADCILLQKLGEAQPFYQKGECYKRVSPWSTFKIPLAIMGYNKGVLQDTEHPVWKYKEGYDDWLPVWRNDQTPRSWIKNSVVWYSQVLTKKLGKRFIQTELKHYHYGNQNIADFEGKPGLTNSWLGSTLKITPVEQVNFLSHVAQGHYIRNPRDFIYLKDLLKQEKQVSGWTLYGKTGSSGLTKNPAPGEPYRISWFVGWLEKGTQKIAFAVFEEQKSKDKNISGPLIRDAFLKKLPLFLTQTH